MYKSVMKIYLALIFLIVNIYFFGKIMPEMISHKSDALPIMGILALPLIGLINSKIIKFLINHKHSNQGEKSE